MSADDDGATGRARLRWSPLLRAAFWCYAAALFVTTHWPKLEVPGPAGTDKAIHIVAFGGWAMMCALCGWFGRPMSGRNVLLSGLVSAAYAGLDEALQEIEFINRSCEWADFGANLVGVAGMTLALLVFGRLLERAFPTLLVYEG